MPHYMLSVHATTDTTDTGTPRPEPSPEQMGAWLADGPFEATGRVELPTSA